MKKIIYIFLFIAFISGCGSKDEKPKTLKDSTTAPGNVKDISKSDNKVTDTSSKKSASKNELGINEGLPPNFPKEIPQPDNAKCMGYLISNNETHVTFEIKDKKPTEIADFYKKALMVNGYEIIESEGSTFSDKGGMINWKKGNKTVEVTISSNSVVISYN